MSNASVTMKVPVEVPPGSPAGILATQSVDAPVGLLCRHDPCDRPADRKGLCDAHYQRQRTGRDMDNPPLRPWTANSAAKRTSSYKAAHVKLYRRRGKAGGYLCVKCDERARDWSLRHRDPRVHPEMDDATGMRYSMNVDDYDPMCKPCHLAYDGIGVRDDW